MKKNKCGICGKYESRLKELKNGKRELLSEIYESLKIPVIHYWKWCKIHNNWCRCVAGKCGEVVSGKEKKLELENKQGLGFKMTMEDEL
jgi:hypothetical protein